MVRILPRACLIALSLSPFAHSADPAPAPVSGAALERQFRESMDLPSDATIVFIGEDGTLFTSDEFARAMMKQDVSAAVEKDPTGKKFTLRLAKARADANAVPAFLPELDATNLAGQPVRGADLKGRATLFNFFFSTCVPCIKEVPFLNEFRRKHAEYNYVAVTFDPVPEARDFAAQRNFEWPIVADARKFVDAAGVKGYPTYMLVAADGRILARNSGLDVEAMKDPATGLAHIENWVASALARKH